MVVDIAIVVADTFVVVGVVVMVVVVVVVVAVVAATARAIDNDVFGVSVTIHSPVAMGDVEFAIRSAQVLPKSKFAVAIKNLVKLQLTL